MRTFVGISGQVGLVLEVQPRTVLVGGLKDECVRQERIDRWLCMATRVVEDKWQQDKHRFGAIGSLVNGAEGAGNLDRLAYNDAVENLPDESIDLDPIGVE